MSKLIAVVILVAGFARAATATLLVPADLGELARDALAIVRGRVASVDSQWTEDRRAIETIVTLEAESYLKGEFGPTLQFRTPGGVLGRYRSIVVGAPEFAVDEHVVVFLGAHGPSVPHLLGFGQGVFRLVRATDRAAWLVIPPAILPSTTGASPIVRGDPSRKPLTLSDFEQRVHALVGSVR